MESSSPADWIALNLLPGLGPISARRALERFGDPARIAYRVPVNELAALPRVRRDALDEIVRARRTLERRAEAEWRRCRRLGLRVVPCGTPQYPAALGELPDPPVLLYLRGDLPEGVVRVAVVGSRRPTRYGERVATGLAGGLAARGIEVVSGGARGIDTCAHRAALEERGRTVAVLGTGLLCPYPPENGRLFEEIPAHGAVISEFPLDEPPHPSRFPRRNRLISGLCAAVIVVEAAARSGSLITAHHALEQGREVLAVPGPVSSSRSEGCHRLIQQGAKLVQNIEDILEELPPIYRGAVDRKGVEATVEPPPDLCDLTPDEREVLGMLDPVVPVHLDELARRARVRFARLQAALFGLQVRGAVEHSPGRYYLLRPRREP